MKKTYIKAEIEISDIVKNTPILCASPGQDIGLGVNQGTTHGGLAKGRYSEEDYNVDSEGQGSYGDLW